MKIIILGVGQVGGSLAEHLASEANDITVVDTDELRLRELRDRLDIGVITGEGSHPDILIQAGIGDAAILSTVSTNHDVTMCAKRYADCLFRIDTPIARIRTTAALTHSVPFVRVASPNDVLISPAELVS